MTCNKIMISSSVSSGIIHLLTFDFVTIFPPPMFHPSKIPMADTPPKVEATHMQRNTLVFLIPLHLNNLSRPNISSCKVLEGAPLADSGLSWWESLYSIILAFWGPRSTAKYHQSAKDFCPSSISFGDLWEIWLPTFIISELSGTWSVYYTILITSQHCIYV